MKKIIALAVTMVAALSLATAEVTVGLRGIFGLNVGSSFNDDAFAGNAPDVWVGNSLTFGGALFANIPLVEAGPGAIALQPEVGFTHNEVGYDEVIGDFTLVIDSIDIALLCGYNIKATDSITITPFLGPKVSIIAGDATTDLEAPGYSHSDTAELDTSVLVSLAVGAEAAFKAGPGAIVADIRYDIGFNGITMKIQTMHLQRSEVCVLDLAMASGSK